MQIATWARSFTIRKFMMIRAHVRNMIMSGTSFLVTLPITTAHAF